ncbi:MAG: sulfurtransferase TusA family protein [Actinomycetia bacterium]|nr:sulfurtransferase TusA family protein [Actinomycetes bacterium]
MTTLIPDAVIDQPGLSCIDLSPLVKRTIADLATGQLLEVRSDDVGAREGLPSWCRLTGHTLLDTVEHDLIHTTFLIQSK